jgi:hypothetical protein
MAKSHYWPKPWYDRLLYFSEKIGYRFHLHQMILPLEAKPSQRVTLEAVIDNKGCAPIYKLYRFALRFTQAAQTKSPAHHVVLLKQDIRGWMPDLNWFRETIAIPRGLKRGVADVSCAIVNSANRPVVKLAIKPLEKDGWHPLTHLDVV